MTRIPGSKRVPLRASVDSRPDYGSHQGRSWSRTSTTVLWVPLGREPPSLGSSRLATPSEVRRVSAKDVSPMGHVLNQRHLEGTSESASPRGIGYIQEFYWLRALGGSSTAYLLAPLLPSNPSTLHHLAQRRYIRNVYDQLAPRRPEGG